MTDAATLARAMRAFPQLVEKHLASTGERQTTFGKEACGVSDFVRRLRAGENFRVETVLRVLDHIAMKELI